jgi:protein-S-isoprenylcysteine O-methyltransferase Ste14
MKIWQRALLDIVTSLIYLLAAIFAFGGFAAYFAHPALTAVALVTLIGAVAAVFAGGNVRPGIREDRSNQWVLVPVTLIGLISSFVPALTDRFDFWTLDGEVLRWFGVVIYAIGITVRLVPVFVLRDRFSGLVAIQPGHELVTTGIYSRIRHPSYLGLLMTVLGWSLAFRAGVGLLLTALLLLPLIARIRSEERLLREHFGAEYVAYCARTSRLIPGIY